MSRKTQNQQGFSLLEVLISIAIVAGIAVALVPAISATARTASRIHSAAKLSEEMRTGGEVFRRLTSQMVSLNADGSQSAFSGERESMSFTSVDTLTGDPIKYKILATDDGNVSVSVGALNENALDGSVRSYELLKNVNNVRFDYFDADDETWRHSWNEIDRLPSLVRIQGKTTEPPQTTISIENAPRATASFDCQFDPVSRICRVM